MQALAHLKQIFRWRVYSAHNIAEGVLLVDDERVYTLIENILASLRRIFKAEYINIAMNEALQIGLGRYLDQHGFVENRFEILKKHLDRVVEIAQKYNFKPIMWSDMFFHLANGKYHVDEPKLGQDIVASIPDEGSLIYWDYYHDKEEYYTKMMKAHAEAGEVWFAGGAWSWGDGGKECSFWALLPSLFAIRKIYDGETDIEKIKTEFRAAMGGRISTRLWRSIARIL